MAEFSSNDKGSNGGTPEKHFSLRSLYVKDVSFEAPLMPEILHDKLPEPDVRLNLRTTHRDLKDSTTEVVLHVEVHALLGERTAFLLEIAQAGTFLITGYSPEETRSKIGIDCPEALFPFLREAVSSLVQRGGFPAVLLYPVDFSLLYRANRAGPAKTTSSEA